MTGWWKRFDWLSLAVTLALIGIGTVAISSAGCARAEAVFHGMWINNLVTAGVGLVLYGLIAAFDYRKGLVLAAVPPPDSPFSITRATATRGASDGA